MKEIAKERYLTIIFLSESLKRENIYLESIAKYDFPRAVRARKDAQKRITEMEAELTALLLVH